MARLAPAALLALALGACAPSAEGETTEDVDETAPDVGSAEEPDLEPTPAVVADEVAEEIDEWLARAVPFGFGGSVAVAQEGEVILRRGYGPADRGARVPIDPDTRFHLGSIAKTYTAVAVLRLVARGRLALNTRVDELWPDAPEDKAALTLHHLLSHTAGLPYHATPGRSTDGLELAEVVELALTEPLASAPGERFAYSNVGYVLLAGVVERASGRPWRDALRALVLEPAGLERTGFTGEPFEGPGVAATSYLDEEGGGRPDAWDVDAGSSGAGDLVATADDVRRFFEALVAGELLPDELLARMLAPVRASDGGARYGYGVFVATTPRGTRVVYHDGDFMGFSGSVRAYPDEDRTLVLLSNVRVRGVGLREPAAQAVALLAAGAGPEPPPLAIPFDAGGATDLVATWRDAKGATIVTQPLRDALQLHAVDPGSIGLLSTRAPDADESRAWTVVLQETLTAAARGDRAAAVAGRSASVVDRGLEPAVVRLLAGLPDDTPIRVLGHVHHGGPGEGYSYARVGSRTVGLLWVHDGWMAADEARHAGHAAHALSTGERTFVLHDLVGGGTVTIQVEGDALGIEGPGGSATFERVR